MYVIHHDASVIPRLVSFLLQSLCTQPQLYNQSVNQSVTQSIDKCFQDASIFPYSYLVYILPQSVCKINLINQSVNLSIINQSIDNCFQDDSIIPHLVAILPESVCTQECVANILANSCKVSSLHKLLLF